MDKEVTGASEKISVLEKKYVGVMLVVNCCQLKKRVMFVDPAIHGVRWLSGDREGYWLRIENKPGTKNNNESIEVKIHPDNEDEARRLIEKLGKLMTRPTEKIMRVILTEEGLNCVEAENILKYAKIDNYVKMEIDIKLDSKTNTVEHITQNFIDHEGRRISSVKTIFPFRHQLFSRMKIGPEAGHSGNDKTVVRNFHCRHCFKLLGTTTVEEAVKSGEIQSLCKECQAIEDSLPKDEEETRSYNITARKSVLNNLEVLFREMWILGVSGASRELRLYVDGDGIVRIETKRTDKDEPLAKNCQKSGVLKRNQYLGEPFENGYLTYLDLG